MTLEDFQGSIEVVLFPKTYAKCAPFLLEDQVVLVRGRANVSADGDGKVIAHSVQSIEEGDAPSALWLRLTEGERAPLGRITAILGKYQGTVPVYIYDEKTKQKMKAERSRWVTGEEALCEELRRILGEENVVLKY